MITIISPTKQMVTENDFFLPKSYPIFLNQTSDILDKLQTLDYDELKTLWKCNDKLTTENKERIEHANLKKNISPAIMSYKGLQYQYMAPDLLTEKGLTFLQNHVRILSGFYGILKPFDGIIPYRLEMQAKLKLDGHKNLYELWGNSIYQALDFSAGPVINLASKEYSKVITPYLKETDEFIDVLFCHLIDDKLKVKATPAKMARGEMVRYIAENNVNHPEDLKNFNHPHYKFSRELSTTNNFIFVYED